MACIFAWAKTEEHVAEHTFCSQALRKRGDSQVKENELCQTFGSCWRAPSIDFRTVPSTSGNPHYMFTPESRHAHLKVGAKVEEDKGTPQGRASPGPVLSLNAPPKGKLGLSNQPGQGSMFPSNPTARAPCLEHTATVHQRHLDIDDTLPKTL